MARISKATREAAALICDVRASTPSVFSNTSAAVDLGISASIEDGGVIALSLDAWLAVAGIYRTSIGERADDRDAAIDAEAAALLRDGWSPGEEVVRIADIRKHAADSGAAVSS